MLMVFTIASTFNEIRMLQNGQHDMDKTGRVKDMVDKAQIDISFRAGLEIGTAMIGPLGSDKRKIVTAIGKAVNNASRMESSGEKEKIHTTQKVMAILKDASITRDTTNIWQIIRKNKDLKELTVADSLDFFDCYKIRFKLGKDMICEKNNVTYKEFSQDITYWIQCIPD